MAERHTQRHVDRHVLARLREALKDRPVVLLHGARQTGKTTLVRRTLVTRNTWDVAATGVLIFNPWDAQSSPE